MNALERLADSFARLPGIGKKTATRLAYFCLDADSEFLQQFSHELAELKTRMRKCSICGAFTESDPCPICNDASRNHSVICVVEQAQDIATIDSFGDYQGVFHVLGGVIAPLDGVGPEKLAIGELSKRVKDGDVNEVILALNPNIEGETTVLYLQKLLTATKPELKVSRLASGLPVGSDIGYVDKLTLLRSFRDRTVM